MAFFQKAILHALGQRHKLEDPHARRNREEQQRKAESTPPPLPTARIRALTSTQAADQRRSPLFGKLSAELRNLIYEHVLADGGPEVGQELHLANMHQRLGCIRCLQLGESVPGWKHKCWGLYHTDGTHIGPLIGQPQDASPVPLLRSCRRVYVEAVDILYTHNKFTVRQCKTIVDLERTILPHRLNAIRHLHVDLPLALPVDMTEISFPTYPPDPSHSMWVPACQVLARMMGLQNLRVTVYESYRRHNFNALDNPDYIFVQLLQPLMDIKVSVFEVCLGTPIDISYVLGCLGATPFSLVNIKN